MLNTLQQKAVLNFKLNFTKRIQLFPLRLNVVLNPLEPQLSAQCAVCKEPQLNGHQLLFMFLARPAQPTACGQHVACDRVLCCPQKHLK